MKYQDIKARRKKLKLTQEQVARAADIGLRHYPGIEYRETVPGMMIAGRLAAVLETTIDGLWDISGKAT